MSDRLFLNLWFPSFREGEMMPRTASVLRTFPFSQQRPGITSVSVSPVDYGEPTVFQQTFDVAADVDRVVKLASEFTHSDYAFTFEMFWDMYVSEQPPDGYEMMSATWRLEPQPVRMTVHGTDFDDQIYQEAGHIQFDLGLDSMFLQEEIELDDESEPRIKANVQKLVEFTQALEKNTGISGRVLWSESDESENLAQKLIARLQRVQ